jgi:imidazolonepropionase-like amidohydrolase
MATFPCRSLLVCVLAAALAAAGRGQNPADEPTIVVHAGRIFDSEAAAFVGPRDLRIEGTRIAAVAERLDVPAGAREIDCRALTVLPGLIDVHTHLLYLEDPKSSLALEGMRAVVMEGDALRALRGAARARTFLDAGITTVRDLGNSGRFVDVALKRAIAEGSVPGCRMLASGPGLSAEGGQFPGVLPKHQDLVAEEYRIVRGPVDAALAVREHVVHGADLVKVYADSAPNRGMLTPEELRAIVAEARRLGFKVAAHAVHDASVRAAVEAGVDSIEHGYTISDATLRLMAEKGTVLVPTDVDSGTIDRLMQLKAGAGPAPSKAAIEGMLKRSRLRLARARELGVRIAAGSDNYLDCGIPQGEAARRVLFAYADAGLTPAEVLQAATRHAADLLGRGHELGVLREGALADLVAVAGDLERDIHALEDVHVVIAAGRVHRARTEGDR